MDDATLSRELAAAARQAVETRHRLDEMPKDAPGFLNAMLNHLQASMLHLAIISVAQARQIESLSAEIDEMRGDLAKALRTKVH
jgi:hypothetical protein